MRLLHALAIGTLAAGTVGIAPAAAAPAASRNAAVSPAAAPNFKAPFGCGQRWTYSHHSAEVRLALDFIRADGGSTAGAPVLASADGHAYRYYEAGGAGNYIVIEHGGGWKTYYFHLAAFSIDHGAAVRQGQQIGTTGSTGNSSGAHQHYEQLYNGVGQTIHINGASLAPYPGSYHQKYLTSDNCGTPVDPHRAWRTQFADIDGDGRDEIIAFHGSGDVWAWRNTGGFAGPNQTYTGGTTLIARGFTSPASTRFADVDGDGRAEIIAMYGSGDVHAWRNTGGLAGDNRTFSGNYLIARGFTNPAVVRFPDLNGDRRADITSIGADTYSYRNTGGLAGNNQTYTAGGTLIAHGFSSPGSTYFSDIDGDGRDEIVTAYDGGDVWAWRNTGGFAGPNQTFTAGTTLIARGFRDPDVIRFADIDTGGRGDIIAVGSITYAYRNTGGLAGNNQTYTAGGTDIAHGFS